MSLLSNTTTANRAITDRVVVIGLRREGVVEHHDIVVELPDGVTPEQVAEAIEDNPEWYWDAYREHPKFRREMVYPVKELGKDDFIELCDDNLTRVRIVSTNENETHRDFEEVTVIDTEVKELQS